jgi:hypothetical protein
VPAARYNGGLTQLTSNGGLIRNAKRPRCRRRATGDCRVLVGSSRLGRASTCGAFSPLILSSTRLCTYGMRKAEIFFGLGVTNRGRERSNIAHARAIKQACAQDKTWIPVTRHSAWGMGHVVLYVRWAKVIETVFRKLKAVAITLRYLVPCGLLAPTLNHA